MTGTPWAKAIAVGFEACLPFRFQHAFDEGVAGSIGHGRDAEWSWVRRVWFRDPDAADRCGGAVEGEGLCQGEALGGGEGFDPVHTCGPFASIVLRDVADHQEPGGPGMEQEALELAHCGGHRDDGWLGQCAFAA